MSLLPTVAGVLARAGALGVERIEAQWLLGHVLGRPRSWLAAHPEAPIASVEANAIDSLLTRRADGEPLAYLLGEQTFGGLALQVDRRVLVPRADTETLVGWALERIDALSASEPRVIDLGTGSGAVALALCTGRPRARVCATDLSADALEVARGNAARLGLACRFWQGRWWQAVGPDAPFDLVVSNPPYIAAGDPHLSALHHEPALALVAGPEGLDAIREIVVDAGAHLAPDGWLLIEHGHDQGPAVRRLLDAAGFVDVQTRVDGGGRERCSGGRSVSTSSASQPG